MEQSVQEWSSVNQQFLAAMIAVVRKRLEFYEENDHTVS